MRTILTFILCAAALVAAEGHRRAPGFALVDLHQQFHDLADYRGKVLLLEFMSTTCPHCADFAKVLDQVQKKYGDKVAILAVVNVNTDRPEQIQQYIAGHGITYPIVLDQGQMMYSYLMSPAAAQLPHVYVIDPAGYIRVDYVYNDVTTRDIFEGAGLFRDLDRLLGQGGKK
jgi:peroxiredoxin